MADAPLLDDGVYEVLVVDANTAPDGSIGLDLTIVAGPGKGEVVRVRATGVTSDALELLGMPATLVVADGQPSVTFDE